MLKFGNNSYATTSALVGVHTGGGGKFNERSLSSPLWAPTQVQVRKIFRVEERMWECIREGGECDKVERKEEVGRDSEMEEE